MPCDSIVINRVELPSMDEALRIEALKAMGATDINVHGTQFRYQRQFYSIQGGKLVGQDQAGIVADTLKRKYSAEVVKYTARRAGWQVKQVSEDHFQVIKR